MYPLISVVPQEIIFRRYMFDRYKTAFSPRVLVLVSGVGFKILLFLSLLHVLLEFPLNIKTFALIRKSLQQKLG
jgi:uncharacterized protein